MRRMLYAVGALATLLALAPFAAFGGPAPGKGDARTRAQVDAIIEREGTARPQWWDRVPLEYPRSLDLSWPPDPPAPWDPQKNVGQYIWSIINENPARWRSGVRFLHYLLTVHKDDTAKLHKVMDALARAYCVLLGDWARAAFWWRMADDRGTLTVDSAIHLAECYWKLGSKSMALRELARTNRYHSAAAIKLRSDMGDLDDALARAEAMAKAGLRADGYLVAGDACRLHGRHADALVYYQKVLRVPAEGRHKDAIEKLRNRAQANIEAVEVFDNLDLTRVPDGAYRASSIAYEAPVEIEVTVARGRIESVRVTQHREKQFYSSIAETPRQIVEKQGVKGVDAVTGATITSEAIINATAKALSRAMKK